MILSCIYVTEILGRNLNKFLLMLKQWRQEEIINKSVNKFSNSVLKTVVKTSCLWQEVTAFFIHIDNSQANLTNNNRKMKCRYHK